MRRLYRIIFKTMPNKITKHLINIFSHHKTNTRICLKITTKISLSIMEYLSISLVWIGSSNSKCLIWWILWLHHIVSNRFNIKEDLKWIRCLHNTKTSKPPTNSNSSSIKVDKAIILICQSSNRMSQIRCYKITTERMSILIQLMQDLGHISSLLSPIVIFRSKNTLGY
jgi:hypothetical protein